MRQMPLTIQLLGPPSIRRDGLDADERSPKARGRKAWGLLAYLILGSVRPARERLAGLLFAEADDPLGALRWNLAEVRRLLGPDVRLGGDPVALELPPDADVDVSILTSGTWVDAMQLPGLGHDLLQGVSVGAGAAFETWLSSERRHFAGLSAAILREAATTRLAAGDGAAAADLATRLIAIDEFDEEAHALLIRSLAAAGDGVAARRQLRASIELLRRELGVEPSATLVRAADDAGRISGGRESAQSRPATAALLEAGRAAVNAGAVDAGMETLRRAIAEARGAGDQLLESRGLLALGVAYVHAGRGRDGEGATVLHRALSLAEAVSDATTTSEASRELDYIEFLRARYDRARSWLARSIAAAPDDGDRAASMGVEGAVACDLGRTQESVTTLTEAAAIGRALGKSRVEGWAEAFLGRTRLLRGELDLARVSLVRALEICRAAGWVSFAPWPQALLAQVDLEEGRIDAASEGFEAAFAVGCQLGDPCWEGMGARGIGLVRMARGDIEGGLAWLDDARIRCIRIPDAYVWIHAFCLDALCAAGVAHGPAASARRWVSDLEAVAARSGMREMLVRAQLHRIRSGDPSAIDSARLFAAEIDSPAVLMLVSEGDQRAVPAPAAPAGPAGSPARSLGSRPRGR